MSKQTSPVTPVSPLFVWEASRNVKGIVRKLILDAEIHPVLNRSAHSEVVLGAFSRLFNVITTANRILDDFSIS